MVDIECKLCNKIIKFDENSPDTYLSKTESGNAMIGKLFTFRVSHKLEDNIQHINVVVIDQNGEYRAHKDYYEEVTEKGSTDLWDKLVRQFPIELRPYLNLASNDDKILLSTNLEEPFNKSIEEWYYSFKDLKEKYPMNRLINLFSVRWNFIIGKHKELLNEDILPNPWSFPQYLRLKARFSPSPDLIDKINEIDTNNLPILIQIETKVAKSEIYLRLGRTDLLESLYEEIYEKWDRESSIETKTGLMLVQAYYSFGLCTLGKIKKALNLVEPSFNFGEILENREIISIAGNFFAAILQAGGELDKALEIYNIVLETSKEIGDERMQAVILTNISIIESKQGLYDKALKRQKSILKLPIVQEEYYLKSSLQGIIGETLFIAERYEESIELCKNILSEEHVSTYYKSQALSTLKKIAGKQSSQELLEYVRENLLEDKDFRSSPMGKIFKYDLQAIEAELQDDWMKMVENLIQERKTMISSKSVEDVSDIEIRLAQGYYKFYQETNNLEYLNHSYNHLDLAKIIAVDNQSYLDLARLNILKGLLALESKIPEQAKKHFNEALEIAKKHDLKNVEETVIHHIDELERGTIDSSESVLRKMFRILTFRKSEEKPTPIRESKIFSIYLNKVDNSWESFFKNDKEGNIEHISYLKGFCDLWKNLQGKIVREQVDYFPVSKGSVLVENTENFQLIAYCNDLDYMTRLSIQDILDSLEKFSLKNIPEELTKKSLEIINNNLSKFKVIE